MIVKIKPEIIEYERMIQGLCKTPFYGHSKGCPNFGKKQGCPPNLPLINKILDFSKDVYVIYTEFAVHEFAERIKQKHPEWNARQCYNPRYWQPKARKVQRAEEKKALEKLDLTLIVNAAEAHGVNLTKLMADVKVDLDWNWPPNKNVYLISLGGYPV